MAKRKDTKGIVLKTGEHQRKDGRYEYKYTDEKGKRHSVYGTTLKELREKEEEIEKIKQKGLDYHEGRCTATELAERFLESKQSTRYMTRRDQLYTLNWLKEDEFFQKPINRIKMSDVKLWAVKKSNEGKNFAGIKRGLNILKQACDMAIEEDIVDKNPFKFRLSDVIADDKGKRSALTEEQVDIWLTFVKTDNVYSKYYHEILFLLQTGLRISEFCGITLSDIDFENKRLNVQRQLLKQVNGTTYIEKPKTKTGYRSIPLTDNMIENIKILIENRPKFEVEPELDGVKGFLFFSRNNSFLTSEYFDKILSRVRKKFEKKNPDVKLPKITPHVLRHTFCTTLANRGVDVKTLQYLMGHSTANVTMNVYMHHDEDVVAKQMEKAPTYDF